ncbi:MAG TPA: hypothetical protein VI113_07150 [Alphaproteobacteria bacterium]
MRLALLCMFVIAAAILSILAIVELTADEGAMPVAEFNRHIAEVHQAGESWLESPRAVALSFVGEDCDCGKRTVANPTGDSASQTMVIVTDEGAHDDSIDTTRFRIFLSMTEAGYWKIDRARQSWRCWPGRGHRHFSTEPCG